MLIQRKRAPLTRVGLLVVDPKQRFSPIAVLDWPPANTTISSSLTPPTGKRSPPPIALSDGLSLSKGLS
jgi:hypothetical protein